MSPLLRWPLIVFCIAGALGAFSFIPRPWGIVVAVPVALGGLYLVREEIGSVQRPGEDDLGERNEPE